MKIIPRNDYVVLKEVKETETKSGLILPENADIETTGIAIFVSGENAGIQESAHVYFKRHLFDEYTLDKETFLLGKEDAVIAVLHD